MFDKLRKPKRDKHRGYDKYAVRRFIDSLDYDSDLNDENNETVEEKEQINDLLSTTIFGFPGVHII